MQGTVLWIPKGAFCPLEGGGPRHIGTSLTEAQARLHVYAESIEADEGKMRSVPPLQHKQEHYLSQPSIPISLSLNRISLNQINLPILLKGFQSLKLMYLSQMY